MLRRKARHSRGSLPPSHSFEHEPIAGEIGEHCRVSPAEDQASPACVGVTDASRADTNQSFNALQSRSKGQPRTTGQARQRPSTSPATQW